MNAINKQTAVAQGVAKAVGRKAKQAGPVVVKLPRAERVGSCIAAFTDYQSAVATLENAKAEWDAARLGLRSELEAAKADYTKPSDWSAFLRDLRPALVSAGIVATVKAARTLVDNQLNALGLTGNTERAGMGGARPGSGRKEKAEPVGETLSEKVVSARLVSILAYVAEQQAKPSDDAETILGRVAALANGVK